MFRNLGYKSEDLLETFKAASEVLAADHLDPEGTPAPARVARFFDNGEKEVVRIRFRNGEELVCTPSHRFYVCGKGWICAENLGAGAFQSLDTVKAGVIAVTRDQCLKPAFFAIRSRSNPFDMTIRPISR